MVLVNISTIGASLRGELDRRGQRGRAEKENQTIRQIMGHTATVAVEQRIFRGARGQTGRCYGESPALPDWENVHRWINRMCLKKHIIMCGRFIDHLLYYPLNQITNFFLWLNMYLTQTPLHTRWSLTNSSHTHSANTWWSYALHQQAFFKGAFCNFFTGL